MNTKTSLVARIGALIAAAGPMLRNELVFTGKKGEEDYHEYGEFAFKRLSFFEMDTLRLHSVNSKGQFDPGLHIGNNARMVAATLADEDGSTNMPVDSINFWPSAMVDAFAAAANRVNSNFPEAIKEATKNSEATPSAKQS